VLVESEELALIPFLLPNNREEQCTNACVTPFHKCYVSRHETGKNH
jgi:hypothetical protein